jgi:hypothetical protein
MTRIIGDIHGRLARKGGIGLSIEMQLPNSRLRA